MKVTVVYPYYMNNQLMNFHINEWKGYSEKVRNNIRFIVVDDGSPFPLMSRSMVDWGTLPDEENTRRVRREMCVNLEDVNVNLDIYRVRENLGYNLAGAKNLGALLAQTDWLFLCDFDYVLPPSSAEKLIEIKPEEGNIYFPMWYKPNGKPATKHENNFLISKWDFWWHGGYDEDFAGFYAYEETYYVSNVLCKNLNRVNTNEFFTVWYDEDKIADAEWPRCMKDFWHNHDLCDAKVAGLKHSKRCLRFSWEPVWKNSV